MVWSPTHEESCQFLYLSKMKGQMLGNVWLSESKEFALSWKPTNPSVVDCGHAFYGPGRISRSGRSHSQSVGLVTSNQLAAQLLAVENASQGAVVTLFRHALISLCDKINSLAFSLHSALLVDPTYVVRTMLQRLDIAATLPVIYHGNGVLQIYRCFSIPAPNYSLRPFNATCYAKPSVKVVLPSGTSVSLFWIPLR
ncbi:unnamed protein product [Heligmosomoides polygyrus]|uniref:Uncharacterized protein n=1 Tax=Heligmosomoides polygyrus TaxID=6339 RepID=A0A183G8X1_HELPZ|nr:unnamed protein product [Heligmosomoides polygyrus]